MALDPMLLTGVIVIIVEPFLALGEGIAAGREPG
jgi:hypothetical protein